MLTRIDSKRANASLSLRMWLFLDEHPYVALCLLLSLVGLIPAFIAFAGGMNLPGADATSLQQDDAESGFLELTPYEPSTFALTSVQQEPTLSISQTTPFLPSDDFASASQTSTVPAPTCTQQLSLDEIAHIEMLQQTLLFALNTGNLDTLEQILANYHKNQDLPDFLFITSLLAKTPQGFDIFVLLIQYSSANELIRHYDIPVADGTTVSLTLLNYTLKLHLDLAELILIRAKELGEQVLSDVMLNANYSVPPHYTRRTLYDDAIAVGNIAALELITSYAPSMRELLIPNRNNVIAFHLAVRLKQTNPQLISPFLKRAKILNRLSELLQLTIASWDYMRPYEHAIDADDDALLKVLLDFSSIDDLQYKNAIGQTVLEYALEKNKASAIMLILNTQHALGIRPTLTEHQKNNLNKSYFSASRKMSHEKIINNLYFFIEISHKNVLGLTKQNVNRQELERHNEVILILDSHIKKIESLGGNIYSNENREYLNRLSLVYESVVIDIHLYWLRVINYLITNKLIASSKSALEEAIAQIKTPIEVIDTHDQNIPTKIAMSNLIETIQKSTYFVEYFLNNLSRTSMFDIIINNNPYLMEIIFNGSFENEELLSVFTNPIFLNMIDFEHFFENALVYLSQHNPTAASDFAFYAFCRFYFELSNDKNTLISKIHKTLIMNPILSQMKESLTTHFHHNEAIGITVPHKKDAMTALINEAQHAISENEKNTLFSLIIHSPSLSIKLLEELTNGSVNIKKLIFTLMIQAESMPLEKIISLFTSININEKTSFTHFGHAFSIFQLYSQYRHIDNQSYFSSKSAVMLHYLTHYRDSEITPTFFASTVHNVLKNNINGSSRSIANKIKEKIDDHIRQRQNELWLTLAYLIVSTWVAVPSLYRILQPYFLRLLQALRAQLKQDTTDAKPIRLSEITLNSESPHTHKNIGKNTRGLASSSASQAAASSQPTIKAVPPQTWRELNGKTYPIPELGRLPQRMAFTKLLTFIQTYQQSNGHFNTIAVMRAITAAHDKIKIPAIQFENIVTHMAALARDIEIMSTNNAVIPDDMPLPGDMNAHIEALTISPLLSILLSPAIQRLPETWGELKGATYEIHEAGSAPKHQPWSQLFIFLKAFQNNNGHFDTPAVIQAIARAQNKTKISHDMEHKVLPAMATLFEEIKNIADDSADDTMPLNHTINTSIIGLQQCLSVVNHDNYYLNLVISQARSRINGDTSHAQTADTSNTIVTASSNGHHYASSKAQRGKTGALRKPKSKGIPVEADDALETRVISVKAPNTLYLNVPAIPLSASDLQEQYGAFFQPTGLKKKALKHQSPAVSSSTDIIPKVLSTKQRKKYVTLWQLLLSHLAPDATIPSTPVDAYKKRLASMGWVLRMMLALLDDNSEISHLVAHKPKLRQTAATIRNIICHAHQDIIDTDLSAFCRTLSISDDLHNLNKVLQNTRLYQNLAPRFNQYENGPQVRSSSMFLFLPAPVMAAFIANTATNLHLLMIELEGLNATKKSATDANTMHLIHSHLVTIRELWRDPYIKIMAIDAMNTTNTYSRPVPIKQYLDEMSREANRTAHQCTPAVKPVYDRFFLEIEDIIDRLGVYLNSEDLTKKLEAEAAAKAAPEPSSSLDTVGIKM